MATYDNRHWLLSHIRNSFISTDDTGTCEMVMVAEDLPKLLRSSSVPSPFADLSPPRHEVSDFDCYPEMERSDDEDDMDPLADSYDLHHDTAFGIHRQRSNTAQRLEKMEYAQKKAAKIKVVKWEGPSNLSDADLHQLFSKEPVRTRPEGESLLSRLIRTCPPLPQKRYLEYAKYDGTAQFGLPTKSYKIFMTMLPEDLRNYPVNVCVTSNAKIKDLIGFICYTYTIAHPQIELVSVSDYGLYVCEDDGEVDSAFACLDANEPCSKYGFTCLGLAENKRRDNSLRSSDVTCSIPDKDRSQEIALSDICDVVTENIDKNRKRNVSNVTFKNNTTFVLVDNLPPRDPKTIRGSNSAPPSAGTDVIDVKWSKSSTRDAEVLNRMKLHELSIQAPLYQMYTVQAINKVRSNTPVQLGISGDRIEIDSMSSANLFRSKIKHVSYNIDSIISCEILESKSTRSIFRIHYRSNHSFSNLESTTASRYSFSITNKHLDFECDNATAKEIVDKINMILKVRPSSLNRDFMMVLPKKEATRKSFI